MSCSWPIDRSCLPVAVAEPDIAQQEDAEDLAVQVLWALSGRQFGVCPVKVRPCPPGCGSIYDLTPDPPLLAIWDGANWRNIACGCGRRCSWVAPNVVHLGLRVQLPIQSVEAVVIDGIELDPSEYALEGDLLYRVNGNWPAQDLTKPLDSEGTWAVTFLRGYPPPAGTGKLVALLAKEFLAACAGGKCRIPRRVRQVSRQGVTYDMADPVDILANGKTGIPEIDLWLASVNPKAMAAPPTVR